MTAPHDPADAIRVLPGVRDVFVQPTGTGTARVVIVVAGDVRDRAALRDQAVRAAARAGVAALPLVYDTREWEAAGRPAADAADPVVAGMAARRADGRIAERRAAVRLVRDLRMALEAITEPQPVPQHVKLDVCARVVRDGLSLLFAVHELPAGDDVAVVAAFEQHFAGDGGFPARYATLPLRLAGLARQAELAWWATARDDDRRFPADSEIDDAAEFLRLLERHLDRYFTSDAERAASERRRRLGAVAVAPLLAGLFFARLVASQPDAPLTNLSVVTAPGAIAGEYFAGDAFDRKLFERDDPAISISDTASRDPRLDGDGFSVRWSGYMFFDQPGRWHLCGKADDGQRLWFNRRLLLDDWHHAQSRLTCADVQVLAGWYPVRVDYHQATGHASLDILRGPPRRSLDVVSPSALCCARRPAQAS